MDELVLYSRPDCHLCDLAAALLGEVAPGTGFESVNIEDDIQLLARYGVSVPVFRRMDNGDELAWPFDGQGLREFLAPP